MQVCSSCGSALISSAGSLLLFWNKQVSELDLLMILYQCPEKHRILNQKASPM